MSLRGGRGKEVFKKLPIFSRRGKAHTGECNVNKDHQKSTRQRRGEQWRYYTSTMHIYHKVPFLLMLAACQTLLIWIRTYFIVGVHRYSHLLLHEWLTYSISRPWHVYTMQTSAVILCRYRLVLVIACPSCSIIVLRFYIEDEDSYFITDESQRLWWRVRGLSEEGVGKVSKKGPRRML